MSKYPTIFIVKESRLDEKRVALIPRDVAKLVDKGYIVYVEDLAGVGAGYHNVDYEAVGARIRKINYELMQSYAEAFENIDIIVRVKRPNRNREQIENIVIKSGTKMVGSLDIFERDSVHVAEYVAAGIDYYTLEQYVFPADSPMNAFYDMSRMSGKLAVADAIKRFNRTVTKIAIIGFGEVGKSAYQNCLERKINHIVITSDEKKAQFVCSNGGVAVFVDRKLPLSVRQDMIKENIKDSNIIITAAAPVGSIAPILLPESTLFCLKSGTLVIDIAATDGGNVVGSKQDTVIILENGVQVVNISGYPKIVPIEASISWSTASYYFLEMLITAPERLAKLKYQETKDTV